MVVDGKIVIFRIVRTDGDMQGEHWKGFTKAGKYLADY